MKAQCLRIGNKVGHNLTELKGNYFDVIEVATDNMKIRSGHDHYYVSEEDVEGIPLSEEWLLKGGFERHETKLITSYEKKLPVAGIKILSVHIQKGNQYIYLKECDSTSNIPTDLVTIRNGDIHGEFYLHQLQNVWYILTNEELTFKN